MKKRYTGNQIVAKLRQADVLIGKDKTVPEVCREIEVSQQTYYRWRQKYGGMSPEMIKELRELQKENARLKKVVADQALDNQILKEAIHTSKTFYARRSGAGGLAKRGSSGASVNGRSAGPWANTAVRSDMKGNSRKKIVS